MHQLASLPPAINRTAATRLISHHELTLNFRKGRSQLRATSLLRASLRLLL